MRQDRISGRRFENPNSLPPALMRLAKSILNCPHADWRRRERKREMSCNGEGAREIINGEKVVGRVAGAWITALLSPCRQQADTRASTPGAWVPSSFQMTTYYVRLWMSQKRTAGKILAEVTNENVIIHYLFGLLRIEEKKGGLSWVNSGWESSIWKDWLCTGMCIIFLIM